MIRRFALALASASAVCACATGTVLITLEPGARADSLTFRVVPRPNAVPTPVIYGLSVVHCGTDSPLWTVAADGSRHLPEHVTYGRPIEGFAVRNGPVALTPGCYEALVTGASPLRFQIGADGSAVPTAR